MMALLVLFPVPMAVAVCVRLLIGHLNYFTYTFPVFRNKWINLKKVA